MEEQIIQLFIGIIGTILISLRVILGRKGSLKFRNILARKISECTQHGRKLRRKVYQAFYWSWEQIFALIGLTILIITLLWALCF